MHLFNVMVIFGGFQNESFGYFTKNAEFAGSKVKTLLLCVIRWLCFMSELTGE